MEASELPVLRIQIIFKALKLALSVSQRMTVLHLKYNVLLDSMQQQASIINGMVALIADNVTVPLNFHYKLFIPPDVCFT